MNELILEDQSLETLTEIAKGMYDECKDVIDMIRNNEARLAYFGRILSACRCKVKHGEWEAWLAETFGGALTLRTARRWIADIKDPEAKKVRNEKQAEERAKRPSMAEMKPGVVVTDPDPNPEQRSNTKHTAENAKAKESEKPAPRPVAVQAELVQKVTDEPAPSQPAAFEEKTLSDFSIREIGEYLKESAEEPKERAKWLRKLADELDPPTVKPKRTRAAFTVPSVAEVREYVRSINGKTDAEMFCNHYQAKGWLVGKTKMQDWKAAVRTWENRDNKQGASALRGDEW